MDNDNDSPFIDGVVTFTNSGTTYKVETDEHGKAIIETQLMLPNNYNEMNSLINFYKSEGQITKDESSFGSRKIGLYLRNTENVVVSSDITALWDQNDLGRQWNFSPRVSYILTSRY